MLTITWKILTGDRAKSIAIVISLALTTLLLAQQGAMMLSIIRSTTSLVDTIGGADLWVVDPGSRHVDDITRVLQVVFEIENAALPIYAGQILDVFVETAPLPAAPVVPAVTPPGAVRRAGA